MAKTQPHHVFWQELCRLQSGWKLCGYHGFGHDHDDDHDDDQDDDQDDDDHDDDHDDDQDDDRDADNNGEYLQPAPTTQP